MKTKLLVFLILSFNSLLVIAQIKFQDQATPLGIGFGTGNTYLGSGVSFYDYNNDGWDDITINTEDGVTMKFFKNNNGIFSLDPIALPDVLYQTKQMNWVDFDNDGDKDIFVTSDVNYNKLFENDGSFNFTDITSAAGFPLVNMFTYGSSWGDINNDGFLDVFISNRDGTYTYTNKLYQNNGDGTFTDVTVLAGVDESRLSFCSAFFDYNNDGWQDIYVSNDKYTTANLLYENNGDGTFTDMSQASETDLVLDAMTTTIGDFNNDGWFDIYVTNTQAGNALLRNNGDGTFTDIASSSGTSFNSFAWGAVFLDADNDKDLDLYVSGAFDFEIPCCLPAAFYENLEDETFMMSSSNGFTGDLRESYSNAIGDVDNDGLPDIVVTNNDHEDMFLWRNLTTTNNNYLKVKLEGTGSNRDGIGSRIEISVNGEKQYRYTLCGEGYLAQSSNSEFFGVGTATTIDYVKVTWLSGIEDILYNVSVNQTLSILEGSETLSVNMASEQSQLLVYPTIFENHVYLEGSNNEIGEISIYDMLGKQIYQEGMKHLYSKKLNLSELTSGVYFLQRDSQNGSQIFKIIKK
jgi:hypothetical protein